MFLLNVEKISLKSHLMTNDKDGVEYENSQFQIITIYSSLEDPQTGEKRRR